ncbi:hypothetical protein ER308_02610 [Egibacter rhizosphaerae]|uniref:DUF1468 domain-containing protein n=1 Tax=Egibacter rhizosphaerae TaxID=1670831 RepID=A0A411YBL0_9ACTN|nr:tripartite tricarboxylate transporter TctB family protein [Egibacter rhizosphaerae]QBI18565.1 hypothetical protein ER308_02610 [Egibacter rhizosphaerae]
MSEASQRPGFGQRLRRYANVPDALFGSGFVALGTWMAQHSLVQWGVVTEDGRLEPGGMPFLAGSLLAVLGLGVILTSLRPGGKPRTDEAAEARNEPAPADKVAVASGTAHGRALEGRDGEASAEEHEVEVASQHLDSGADADTHTDRPTRALAVFGITVAAVVVAEWMGLLPALGLMMVAMLVFMERVAPWVAVVIAVVVSIVAHLIFVEFLNVPLPEPPFL